MERDEALYLLECASDADAASIEAAWRARRQQLADEQAQLPAGRVRDRIAAELQAVDMAARVLRPDLEVEPLAPARPPEQRSTALDPGALQSGQLLGGRYELRRRIGEGPVAWVWSAMDRNRGEEVALKVLRPQCLGGEESRQRLHAEVATASRIGHPGLCKVNDLQRDGEIWFISEELADGTPLHKEWEAAPGRKLPFDRALAIVRGVGGTLEHVHRQGAVHGNLKLSNVFVLPNGQTKLVDMGMARVRASTGAHVLVAAVDVAPEAFLAPEQMQPGRVVDARADQWALAALLHALCTGESPAGRVEEPRARCKQMPRSASKAILRALSARPEDRHADIAAFVAALAPSAAGRRWKKVAIAAGLLAALAASAPAWWEPAKLQVRTWTRDDLAKEQAKRGLDDAEASLDELAILMEAADEPGRDGRTAWQCAQLDKSNWTSRKQLVEQALASSESLFDDMQDLESRRQADEAVQAGDKATKELLAALRLKAKEALGAARKALPSEKMQATTLEARATALADELADMEMRLQDEESARKRATLEAAVEAKRREASKAERKWLAFQSGVQTLVEDAELQLDDADASLEASPCEALLMATSAQDLLKQAAAWRLGIDARIESMIELVAQVERAQDLPEVRKRALAGKLEACQKALGSVDAGAFASAKEAVEADVRAQAVAARWDLLWPVLQAGLESAGQFEAKVYWRAVRKERMQLGLRLGRIVLPASASSPANLAFAARTSTAEDREQLRQHAWGLHWASQFADLREELASSISAALYFLNEALLAEPTPAKAEAIRLDLARMHHFVGQDAEALELLDACRSHARQAGTRLDASQVEWEAEAKRRLDEPREPLEARYRELDAAWSTLMASGPDELPDRAGSVSQMLAPVLAQWRTEDSAGTTDAVRQVAGFEAKLGAAREALKAMDAERIFEILDYQQTMRADTEEELDRLEREWKVERHRVAATLAACYAGLGESGLVLEGIGGVESVDASSEAFREAYEVAAAAFHLAGWSSDEARVRNNLGAELARRAEGAAAKSQWERALSCLLEPNSQTTRPESRLGFIYLRSLKLHPVLKCRAVYYTEEVDEGEVQCLREVVAINVALEARGKSGDLAALGDPGLYQPLAARIHDIAKLDMASDLMSAGHQALSEAKDYASSTMRYSLALELLRNTNDLNMLATALNQKAVSMIANDSRNMSQPARKLFEESIEVHAKFNGDAKAPRSWLEAN